MQRVGASREEELVGSARVSRPRMPAAPDLRGEI